MGVTSDIKEANSSEKTPIFHSSNPHVSMKESTSMDDCKYSFKVLVIGDPGVGKTSLIRRFTKGYFCENNSSTVGVDIGTRILDIHGDRVKLQCTDTAGQEKFRGLTQSYYRSADAVILVFDITNRGTFASIPQWLVNVQRYAAKNVMKVLVGNKTDLKGASRKVNTRSAANLAEFEDLLYLETSAKWDDNVEILITELAEQLRENAKSKSKVDSNDNCQNSGATGLLKMGLHRIRESLNNRDPASTALLAQN